MASQDTMSLENTLGHWHYDKSQELEIIAYNISFLLTQRSKIPLKHLKGLRNKIHPRGSQINCSSDLFPFSACGIKLNTYQLWNLSKQRNPTARVMEVRRDLIADLQDSDDGRNAAMVERGTAAHAEKRDASKLEKTKLQRRWMRSKSAAAAELQDGLRWRKRERETSSPCVLCLPPWIDTFSE